MTQTAATQCTGWHCVVTAYTECTTGCGCSCVYYGRPSAITALIMTQNSFNEISKKLPNENTTSDFPNRNCYAKTYHHSGFACLFWTRNSWSNCNALKISNTKPLCHYFKRKWALDEFWSNFRQVSEIYWRKFWVSFFLSFLQKVRKKWFVSMYEAWA